MNQRDTASIRNILARDGRVSLAYLYGSSLGRRDFRDVDVALALTSSPRRGFDSMDFRIKTAAALGRRLPWEFDVHLLEEMPLSVQYRVIATGRCLVSRSDIARTRYEARVLNQFLDFKPTHDWFIDKALQRASRL